MHGILEAWGYHSGASTKNTKTNRAIARKV
jgi:hypothetical protein